MPAIKQTQVKTKRQSAHHAARLPHERDESEDSQESGSGDRRNIRQAYADVQRGLQDTDLRGSLGSTNMADAPQKLPPGISGNPPDHVAKKTRRGK